MQVFQDFSEVSDTSNKTVTNKIMGILLESINVLMLKLLCFNCLIRIKLT